MSVCVSVCVYVCVSRGVFVCLSRSVYVSVNRASHLQGRDTVHCSFICYILVQCASYHVLLNLYICWMIWQMTWYWTALIPGYALTPWPACSNTSRLSVLSSPMTDPVSVSCVIWFIVWVGFDWSLYGKREEDQGSSVFEQFGVNVRW